ncbi:MAG: DUF4430 domain-containing protein [Clostridiales bacterium]|nr:DUF4430 domain-containing protein [Clostridiales bacterium]
MKRSKKALSIIVMLLMVAMTLAPTWAFGTEAAPAAQSGAQESQAAAVETSGAAEPILAKLSVKAYQYAAGDPAKPLKAEASASDGGTLTYQWQSSKDGKNFTDIKDATNAEYTPQTGEAGTVYYRVLVTNTAGGSASSAAGETITVTVAENEITVQAADTSAEPSGSGTAADPYQIGNADQLRWFAEKVNGSTKKSTSSLCAKLTSDIDLTGKDWTPIGQATNTYSDYVAYGGTFDGGGHMVSGLAINNAKTYQALFGYVKGGTIRDLTVKGSVKTSTKSSSYAAGIVSYGNPVTVKNCTNEVDVTASAKGYAAGVCAYLGTGSKMESCANKGSVSGYGDYVGGVAGTVTGSTTTITGCFNHGVVINTGKPGSMNYCTGGIAGGIATGVTVERCGNTGNITSTLKRTGGIAGSAGGTINACFNTGTITGIYGVGGIAGDSGTSDAKVTGCYNTGDVKGVSPSASFKDTNAKGIGGIIGGVGGTNYKASVSGCYNMGTVSNASTLTDITVGGIVGCSAAKTYSGTATENLMTVTNCWYLDTTAAQGDGYNKNASGITAKTAKQIADGDIGDGWVMGPDGHPILGWQDPNATYKVTFNINLEDAKLVVKDSSDKTVDPESDGTYKLKNGTYTYEVTADEYKTKTGSFTVAYSGQSISVSLDIQKYDYVFTTDPEDAKLTVKSGNDVQKSLADGRTYQLAKKGNPYRYTVEKFGYETKSGTLNVKGNADNDKKSVTLKKLLVYKVNFTVEKAAGGQDSTPVITVTSKDDKDADLEADEDGDYHLPDGNYSYSVSCAGYKSVKGDFTVSGKDLTVDGIQLEIQTSWDGESYTEPAKNGQGVYLISSPDELMWFDKNAKMTDSAKLLADITINEDVSGSDATSQKYKWTPIGTDSSKYTGTFDGNGHTISGLYINSTAANTGMFGRIGSSAVVKNLTLADSVIRSTKNYTGAITGYIDDAASVTNCHTKNSVQVSAAVYTGGITGYQDDTSTLTRCSNAAEVTGANNVGGISGYNWSKSSASLTDSYNRGSVSGSNLVGGICAQIYIGGTVSDVYNLGTVQATGTAGTPTAGGITGVFRWGTIKSAYNAGIVKATAKGGVAGRLEASSSSRTVQNVFYSDEYEAVGNLNGCTIQNGTATAKTSDELKALTSEDLGDGFAADTNGINSGYPVLAWQNGTVKSDDPEKDDNGWQGEAAKDAPQQKDGVYQIGTPAELAWFAEKAAQDSTDLKAVLTADLDLNNNVWTGIGGQTADTGFAGTLDGAGHTIKNLYLKNGKGLIPYNKGTVKNLTLAGILKGGDETAALTGTNAGTLEEITSNVTVTGGNKIAGIAGNNTKDGVIKDCHNTGAVTGESYAAGIVAYNEGSVSGCSNTAVITARSTFAGGIAAANTNAVKSEAANVSKSANSGHVIVSSSAERAYAGGVVGWNNASVSSLYNTGNVVSRGGYVGGCLGCNTTGSTAKSLYNLGDIAGSYADTETGEVFNVGGVIGGGTAGTDCWYLSSLAIADADSSSANKADAGTIKNKAGNLASLAGSKETLTGTVTLPEDVQAGETIKASYTDGNGQDPMFVWYRDWGGEEQVLGFGESFTVPNDMVGVKVYVKCMDGDHYGIKTAESGKVQGMSGTVKIQGQEVAGHTLTAVYKGSEKTPKYQWYRGSKAIDGATNETYKLTDDDLGREISVRVTGSLAGYVEAKTGTIKDGASAGIWPEDQCSEPAVKSGVYQISSEKELKWFVNAVNGGNTAINGALTTDIALSTAEGAAGNWYPIGNDKNSYKGTFDGQNHRVTGMVIRGEKNEQGFFGNIDGKGTVKNLKISGDINVTGDSLSTGGIAGYLEGKIIYCEYSGSVSGGMYVGGITGQTGLNAKVTECRNTASVAGTQSIGGITGAVSYGTISKCINTGSVGTEDKSQQAGGIVGLMSNYAVVEGCYNTGTVIGKKNLGGLAGEATVCAVPQGCYNIGSVASGINTGGSVGSYTGSAYISQTTGSFYLAESQAAATDKTATGASSETMKKAAFVTKLNQQIGTEFFAEDTKKLNDGYPILKWQTEGSSEGGNTTTPEDPDKTEISVSFGLTGDTVHGENGKHTGDVTWIDSTSYKMKKGATAQDLFEKALSDAGLDYEMSGNSYVSSISNAKEKVTLSELSNGPYSGWMYTINGKFVDYMSAVTLNDGDVMQFFYVDDYRTIDWAGNKTPQEAADEVAAMIEALPDVDKLSLDDAAAVGRAQSAYNALSDEAKALISKNLKAKLDAAVAKIAQLQKTNQKEFDKIYQETGSSQAALASKAGLTAGTSGGEWVALGLARSGSISDTLAEQYAQAAYQYVKKKGSSTMSDSKSTENSRMILALTSIGKDPSDVAGYDLLEPLADLDYVKSQGINGPIFALIALDSHDYEIPKAVAGKTQTTREALIDAILAAQLSDGGWNVNGNGADADMTAMAIQALAPYYSSNAIVKSAIDDALNRLSQMQEANGGYTSWGTANAESVAQVIVALTSLGIDPASDGRFIKNGYSTLDALATFYNDKGGFKHSQSDTTSSNGLATEQAYYALASWYRLKAGKTSLYDMSDVTTMSKIIEKTVVNGGDSAKDPKKDTLSSGSSLAASGTTRSITKKATIKLGKMTEAAKAALDKLDAVVNANLPRNAKEYTDDQIRQILDAYKAYNALSVSEKKAIEATDTWTAFTEITQNLGSMYHYDESTGIDVRATSAENLPWYIKLVATPKTASEKQKTKVQDALGDNSELFTLYDIHFVNTLDNSEWHPNGLIRVKMPMVSIGNYKTPVIVHIADSGKIRLIEGHVDSAGGTIEFEASDFSLYGIAGSDQSIDSLLGAQAARDVMPWIIAGAIAAAILIAIIVMRKRRNKRGFYE